MESALLGRSTIHRERLARKHANRSHYRTSRSFTGSSISRRFGPATKNNLCRRGDPHTIPVVFPTHGTKARSSKPITGWLEACCAERTNPTTVTSPGSESKVQHAVSPQSNSRRGSVPRLWASCHVPWSGTVRALKDGSRVSICTNRPLSRGGNSFDK